MPLPPNVQNGLTTIPAYQDPELGLTNINRGYFGDGFRGSGNTPQRVINEGIENLNTTNIEAFPPDTPKYYSMLVENNWFISSIGHLYPVKGYRLPLPTHIQDAHEVIYDHNFSWLSAVGGAFRSGPVSGIIGGLTGAVSQGIQAGLGFAVNTFKTVTLQSPQFRTYAFEWRLFPKNKDESDRIRRIYYGIKQGMHPRKAGAGLVFTFPKIYWLAFFPNSEYLFKFKPAVISSCQIDYQGGAGQPAFYTESGAPEGIILRLSFIELDYWVAQDFERGGPTNNDPFNTSDWFSLTAGSQNSFTPDPNMTPPPAEPPTQIPNNSVPGIDPSIQIIP